MDKIKPKLRIRFLSCFILRLFDLRSCAAVTSAVAAASAAAASSAMAVHVQVMHTWDGQGMDRAYVGWTGHGQGTSRTTQNQTKKKREEDYFIGPVVRGAEQCRVRRTRHTVSRARYGSWGVGPRAP